MDIKKLLEKPSVENNLKKRLLKQPDILDERIRTAFPHSQ